MVQIGRGGTARRLFENFKKFSSLALSYIGSVTARHSSSGRQPNFATFNRGRHLYSAGRPSRWALTHISSGKYNYGDGDDDDAM